MARSVKTEHPQHLNSGSTWRLNESWSSRVAGTQELRGISARSPLIRAWLSGSVRCSNDHWSDGHARERTRQSRGCNVVQTLSHLGIGFLELIVVLLGKEGRGTGLESAESRRVSQDSDGPQP